MNLRFQSQLRKDKKKQYPKEVKEIPDDPTHTYTWLDVNVFTGCVVARVPANLANLYLAR